MSVRRSDKQTIAVIVHIICIVKKIAKDGQSVILMPFGLKKQKSTLAAPGPGIYFNAFTHVYSPRAGSDNHLGTNVDVNRKPLSLCPFVASFLFEV